MNPEVPFALLVVPVGSRVTCDPPPLDTDADYLVLLEPGRELDCDAVLTVQGFRPDGSRPGDLEQLPGSFASYSANIDGTKVNLIISTDGAWFAKFLLATDTAKTLNLMSKAHRITLFQAILYGRRG